MKNEYLDFEIGTVLKEMYEGKPCYYIIGEYCVYCNDYECPQIRPWKFNSDECTIASDNESKEFIEALKKNHLIWNKDIGKLQREYEEIALNVKVQVKPGTDINKLIETLNLHVENPFGIYNMRFEKF